MTWVILIFCAATAIASQAQTLTTLHNFAGQPSDGRQPYVGLVKGTDGNFYGTTEFGGANNKGTVFKITPSGILTILHSFTGSDGQDPTAGLIQASDGNFYGTTSIGGNGPGGTVFRITPGGTLTTLVTFNGQGGPEFPYSGVIQATDGNFYGTTPQGGTHFGNGTVYKITANGTVTTLYSFACTDGCTPEGGLVEGTDGNFYGTTRSGGNGFNYGTVFKITPSGTLTTLHTFMGTDGGDPYASMILATDGNFYGTTTTAGADGGGTAFKITPGGTLTTLYNFCSHSGCSDGNSPYGALVQSDGNFYGTTYVGGANRVGTIFELTPQGALTTLHSFNGGDGGGPEAGLVQGSDGNFYGTTSTGGASGDGTVFKITPLISTTTALVTTPNPSYLGETVTMTATVTAQNGSTPTGTVVFNSNGVQIGSVQLNNGVAVLHYSSLPLGTESLTAVYQGSGNFGPSTSNTVLQVVGGTVTSVTSVPNPSIVGQVVNITATVSPGALGGPALTGSVSFSSNGIAIPGCTNVTLSSSEAVCTTASLALGTDVIVASYSGDSDYLPSSGMLVQIVNPVPTAIQLVPVTPCRVVDTRNPDGTFGGPAITGGTARSFPLAQSGNPCDIPSNAVAYSVNVTLVTINHGHVGYLTIWPTGEGQPVVSTMNSPDGRTKANAAIVPAGAPSGAVSVYLTETANVILDIDGYFTAPGAQTLQFYPLPPCRIIDTRNDQDGGTLQAGQERDYLIPGAGNCGVPSSAAAYSFNVTALPAPGGLDYLTVWPEGETRPTVSTLNDSTGTVVANAAIVPAGSNQTVAFYPNNNNTDLLLDVNGYFAAPGSGGYSFYPVTPCRVYDSRDNNGQPFSGERTVNVHGSPCGPPGDASAYVFNATVVPHQRLGYLTLWADGAQQPGVSTLNAYDGFVTSNLAIVPNDNGKTDAFAGDGSTQLILDISGYFAP